ncbi:MAG: hypothetical protein Q9168_007366 [Polycauliona sp. 1 TL-2023]
MVATRNPSRYLSISKLRPPLETEFLTTVGGPNPFLSYTASAVPRTTTTKHSSSNPSPLALQPTATIQPATTLSEQASTTCAPTYPATKLSICLTAISTEFIQPILQIPDLSPTTKLRLQSPTAPSRSIASPIKTTTNTSATKRRQ